MPIVPGTRVTEAEASPPAPRLLPQVQLLRRPVSTAVPASHR